MAEVENEVLSEGTDNDVFNEASNDVPAKTPESEAVVEKPSEPDAGRPRDERGKFVAKPKEEQAETEQPEVKPVETPEAKGGIPSGRLKEEADKRRAAEAERDDLKNRIAMLERAMLAQPAPQAQQKPQPQQPERKRPDPLLDPEGAEAFDNETRAHENAVRDFNYSCKFARFTHKETFDEAFKAVTQRINSGDQALAALVRNSADPGETIVNWYQQGKVFSEIGPDPVAYKTKLKEELLKDPEFIKAAIEAARTQAAGGNGNRPNTVTKLPPSLQTVSGGSAKNNGGDDNSDAAVFHNAFG